MAKRLTNRGPHPQSAGQVNLSIGLTPSMGPIAPIRPIDRTTRQPQPDQPTTTRTPPEAHPHG
jgi:hypothetical protein